MIPGLRGSLLSHDALLAAGILNSAEASLPHRTLVVRWQRTVMREAGPAWTARTVLDRIAVPFCATFNLALALRGSDDRACHGVVLRSDRVVAAFVVLPWGREPGSSLLTGIRLALASQARWCYCFTGSAVRIFDAQRLHSRRHLELDLNAVADHASTLTLAARLFADGSARDGLAEAVGISERHRLDVAGALQQGVDVALAELVAGFTAVARAPHRGAILDESLVVIYRVLFLLFAEARGLVPAWHPIYREAYTIESLRAAVESGRAAKGLWAAVQAMSRLAHDGCHAGTLRVPPFNGRLFSPVHAQLADRCTLPDESVRRALLALTTRQTIAGLRRITFADLGVEQLGAVYERVLDVELRTPPKAAPTLVRSSRRKTTGTFYTPRSLTEYLVRRTLAPLVCDATPDRILSLRILDPAMGSGAFLVAACRYLASAYEGALVREGGLGPSDVTDADRAGFRRLVAQRTLFGIDINPMAVQLARLSLWLATLCHDRPLTFFDHHLRTGNSLVGATIDEVFRVRSGRSQRPAPTPLLDGTEYEQTLVPCISSRLSLTHDREETIEEIRRKEALFDRLSSDGSPLVRLKRLCDLWCAGWFDRAVPTINRATFAALLDSLTRRQGRLSAHDVHRLLDAGRGSAAEEGFFHWDLEFPEVFRDPDGRPSPRPGFDAVIGNPPWEVLRGDAGERGAQLARFARGSDIYRHQGGGHANLYQLFLERSLSLVRRDGRLGIVLPSGFALDQGSAALRRHLLETTEVDGITSVDNREALFPIHRGLRFLLVSLTRRASQCAALPYRSGVSSATEFDRLPDRGTDPLAVSIPAPLLGRFSGEGRVIPDVRSSLDVEIVSHVLALAPAAGDADGWGLSFGRELNATEDKHLFTTADDGLRVIEGKHVSPFHVDLASARQYLPRAAAAHLAGAEHVDRSRLVYRDVAAATNRLTLIAAVLPPATITTHTLFCLKTPLDDDAQHFIAALFNSFVANYLVRLRVTTHVTTAIAEDLPLPFPARDSRAFTDIVSLARALVRDADDTGTMAFLQGTVAHLYGLERAQFAHVLSTFPLVDAELRDASMTAYCRTL